MAANSGRPSSTNAAGRFSKTAPSESMDRSLDSLAPEDSRCGRSTKKRWIAFCVLRKKTSGGVPGTASGIPAPRVPTPTPFALSLHKQPSSGSPPDVTAEYHRRSEQLDDYSESPAVPPRVSFDRSTTPTPANPYGMSVTNSTIAVVSAMSSATLSPPCRAIVISRPLQSSLPSSGSLPSHLGNPSAPHTGSPTAPSTEPSASSQELRDVSSRLVCSSSALRVSNTRAPSRSALKAQEVASLDLPTGAGPGRSYHSPLPRTFPALAGVPPNRPLPDPPMNDTPGPLIELLPTPLSTVASATSRFSSASASPVTVAGTSKMSPQSASKKVSPTPPVPSIVPLSPTPANIYALQTENAVLKWKISELERNAHGHQREIRGLRWLATNRNPTIRPLPDPSGPQALPLSPPAFLSKVPSSGRSGAFSGGENLFSDDLADHSSATLQYDTKAKVGLWKGAEGEMEEKESARSL